ncbi:MAG: ABC transporter ATP-binding protein [Erysipelothrix sp.]
MISFVNVNKKFDDDPVLEDLSLRIPKGSIVGLVGKNGSGKSTFLRLVAGIYHADAGVINIDNVNIFDNPELKKQIFFVSDEPYFFNQSTLKEMKTFYSIFYDSFDEELYQELIHHFDIAEDKPIASFSKGARCQYALILGVAASTPILLLDESFDGLDPLVRLYFRKLIQSRFFNVERCVILSSHNLDDLEAVCDHFAVIKNGSIEEIQTKDSLLKSYHKFHLSLESEIDPSYFDIYDFLHLTRYENKYTVILKGDESMLEKQLNDLSPKSIYHSNLTLDEIFIYQLGDEKYGEIL